MAVVIDRLAIHRVSTFPEFGEQSTSSLTPHYNYLAQTFRAGGNLLHSIEIPLDPTTGPDNLEFRVLITTVVTTANGFHPGAVIYESATIVLPQDSDAALSIVKVDLGAVALAKGATYAFVLDAKVSADGQAGKGAFAYSYVNGVGGTDYPDGIMAVLDGIGTRAQNFAGDWHEGPTADLAFRLVFTSPGATITGTKGNNVIDAIKTAPGQPLPTDNDDFISGLRGRDKIFALGGDDILDGGKDKDQLTGGLGQDQFWFSVGQPTDKVMDFSPADDTIVLFSARFKALTPGVLTDIAFRDIGEAAAKADRVIYKESGAVQYDKDGKGGADPVTFARLLGAPDITAADLLVV